MTIRLPLSIDRFDQLHTLVRARFMGKTADVSFKLDTGCNIVLINRRVLMSFGISADSEWFARRPEFSGTVAHGGSGSFRFIGKAELNSAGASMGSVNIFCHPNADTNCLLGMSALKKFGKITLDLAGVEMRLE